ncbi:Uncharacterized protein CEY00_Acc21797 [Actinidia chinensis var. chinensis]|uniref:Uncharacterized protein n=1 Tax=Actinidia chinensis var. chinensis TaxID=1590841 RepID=A0A2R6P328_ACTCC|nr:Uncharacterized protein CEY00_Acc21797 [Actinidia chinensis var. chinensis]
MLDPGNDLLPPLSSPTISSISSSDLDTESTGSFFHDRSTTLGTLMGVNFPAITFRAPSQRRDSSPAAASVAGVRRRSKKAALLAEAERRRRRRWWRLCRDDEDEDSRPSSLGEFLELERRLFSGATAEHESGVVGADQPRNGRLLFADGRVLPPAQEEAVPDGALCRFPVSLTGICR